MPTPEIYAQMSTEDLQALKAGRYDQISTEGLQMLRGGAAAPEERPPGPGTTAPPKPTFLEALGQSAQERLGEIGQLPGDVAKTAKRVGTTLSDPNLPLRLAPMTVPGAGPVLTSVLNVGTEGLAQAREGQFRPTPLVLAALPALLAGGARAVRAGDRMLTRMSPSRFEAAQRQAMQGAEDVASRLTPDTRALYAAAEQARGTAPPVPLPATGQAIRALQAEQATAPALSPASEGARTLVTKAAPLGAKEMPLADLDAFMRELNLATRTNAPGAAAAKNLSGAVVRDLEAAAQAGNAGADLARQAATGYKQLTGAQRFRDLVTKAAPNRTGLSAPVLNVAQLKTLIRKDPELGRLLGPEGMSQVGQYLEQVRGLPPEHAAQFYPMLLATLGGIGGAGAALAGQNPLTAAGALATPFAAEYLRNLFLVGANPTGLNRALTLAGQAARAGWPRE